MTVYKKIYISLLTLVLVTGCNNGAPSNLQLTNNTIPTTAAITEPQSNPTQKEANKKLGEELKPLGKPDAGVNIQYQLPDNINPGQAFEVEFTLTTPRNIGTLVVEVQAEELEIMNPAINTIFDLADGPEHQLLLSIYTTTSGSAYLNFFISENREGSSTHYQTQSIPVKVGNTTKPPQAKTTLKTQTANTGSLHSMPAQESIINSPDMSIKK